MTKPSCAVLFLVLLLVLPFADFASANPYHGGPPTVTVLSPLTDHVYDQSSDIPIDVRVEMYSNSPMGWEELAAITYRLDDQPDINLAIQNESTGDGYIGTGTGTLSGLPTGPHVLHIQGQTTLSSFNASIVCFVVNSVAPTIQVTSPQPKTYNAISVPLDFKSDKSLTWTAYSLDQTPVVASSYSGSTLINLSNGYHQLRIYGQDSVGKTYASQTTVFKINGKKPPTVTLGIDAMVNARPYLPSDFQNRTYWKLIFNVSEPTSWMGFSLDGGGNQTVDGNAYLRLTYGTHTVIVYAKDVCGNSAASAPYTFTVGPGEAGSAYKSPNYTRNSMPTNSTFTSALPNKTQTPIPSDAFSQTSALKQQPSNRAFIAAWVIAGLLAFVIFAGVLGFKRRNQRKNAKAIGASQAP